MNDYAIRAENLGKKFHIGAVKKNRNFREALIDGLKSSCRRASSLLTGHSKGFSEADETIWALKDVSFEIKRGEIVGIIGRNGAGKSTLLKILSRISEPSEGFVDIYGRVGSLLEVGTGFHHELTGRENVYLNGAILGMKKDEISSKFDEIVAFAEVDKFIDTPVKHYSSGMYLRLAFAVAAHLEPDILLVDEVLAVGDAAFQKKCLGKMSEVAQVGRTVLFVSHNMAAVANLCQNAILLDEGRATLKGEPNEIINRYIEDTHRNLSVPLALRKDRKGKGEIKCVAIEFLNQEGNVIRHSISGQTLIIRMHYKTFADRLFQNCRASIVVSRNEEPYFVLSTEVVDKTPLNLSGEGYIDFIIDDLPLSQSNYLIRSFIESNKEMQDWVFGAAELSVIDGDFYGTGKNYPVGWQGTGVLVRYSINRKIKNRA